MAVATEAAYRSRHVKTPHTPRSFVMIAYPIDLTLLLAVAPGCRPLAADPSPAQQAVAAPHHPQDALQEGADRSGHRVSGEIREWEGRVGAWVRNPTRATHGDSQGKGVSGWVGG